jgi:hypothetical protein
VTSKHLHPSIQITTAILLLIVLATPTAAESVNWQGPAGILIKDVRYPEKEQPKTDTSFQLFSAPAAVTATPYPVPPLAGFSPLVVIATSNEQGSGGNSGWQQTLESTYKGTALNPPANLNYIIGIYDSGADVDLFAGASAQTLGLTGSYLTGNTFPIGGVGGSVDAQLTQPVGFFTAGLSAVNPDGTIDLTQLRGHSNVSAIVTPPINCGSGESISGVIGNPFIAFHTAVIRNDQNRKVFHDGSFVSSPDVQIYQPGSPQIPVFSRKIPLNFSGYATTANYYNISDPFSNTPELPTMLTFFDGFLPLGGSFVTTIYAVTGEPGPTNPIQEMTVMVDTGAQASIISPAMTANLNLPLEPHFVSDACGVGGTVTDIPGYYIDYVKINALGGALEFSNAPFVVLDLTLSDGTPIDGILGMNFFWNRNIIFEPNPAGSGFLHVSEPVIYGNADFNFDGSVNLIDFAMLASAWASEQPQAEYLPVCDIYLDGRINEQDLKAFIDHWLN